MSVTTTGMKVESYEAGLDHLREFTIRKGMSGSYNYALLMLEEDGSHTVYERINMPCWGALREYECGTRPKDPWPLDLRTSEHIFPKTGNPVAVAARSAAIFIPKAGIPKGTPGWMFAHVSAEDWNKFLEFVTDKDISPWRKACNNVELVMNEDGFYQGVLILDTRIDANIMIAMFRQTLNHHHKANNWARLLKDKPELDPRVAYLKAFSGDGYYFSPRILIKDFFNGEPVDISGGKTFYDRESYNRPMIEYIFGGKDNTGEVFSKKSEEQLMAILNS